VPKFFCAQKTLGTNTIHNFYHPSSNLVRGYWETKDSQDILQVEVHKKCYQHDYLQDNILFQAPERAIHCDPKWA
jgi:hypothetical protein